MNSPSHPDGVALRRLGSAALALGRNAEAVAYLQRAAWLAPGHAETYTELGIALAGLGRLEEAEASFRQVVGLRPEDAGAHNHLGAVLAALGKWPEAIAAYHEALRLRPDDAILGNLAEALRAQGRPGEALGFYERALRIAPDSAETHYGLGQALEALGRCAEAEAHYRRALQSRPDAVEVLSRLAALLAAVGRGPEALEYARHGLRLGPGSHSATVCFELGTTFLKSGQFDEAAACYRRALQLRPEDPDALNNLGTALWELGRLEEAEAHYRHALRLRPEDPDLLNNLGTALREQGRTEAAADCYRASLRLRADSPEPLANLGVVLSELGEVDEAEARIRQALRLRPDWAVALDNLGTAYARQGRLDEALACYAEALRLQDDYAEAHRDRAMAWLARGDFERGWPEYEWRARCRGSRIPASAQPRWEGDDLAGRTILLHAEQGLGDTLQFIRFAPLVKERGGRVVLSCPQPLARLLARSPGIDQVIATGTVLPPFDVHAPLLSLPGILGTTLATIPAEVPYLFADPDAAARWRHVLAPVGEFRIGIAWQGNPRHRMDRLRSFPLAKLAPLAGLRGVRLISLQKGAGTEQLEALAERFSVQVLDGWEEPAAGDFLDTAAILSHLDLVVTPDTALAHLAGGAGVPVWVALPRAAEWRWLIDRDDSPWYPTMRLFRQSRAGDWDEVFERMACAVVENCDLTAATGDRISIFAPPGDRGPR